MSIGGAPPIDPTALAQQYADISRQNIADEFQVKLVALQSEHLATMSKDLGDGAANAQRTVGQTQT